MPRGEARENSSPKRETTEISTADESETRRPERKKAKRAAEAPLKKRKNMMLAEKQRDMCRRMANEYQKYTEAFEEWSNKKDHGLDRRDLSNLHRKIDRLSQERKKMWNENRETFCKEANYGLMKLNHNMIQKNQSGMSGWFEDVEYGKEATRDKIDRIPTSTAKSAKGM